jgi:hypothetical protein
MEASTAAKSPSASHVYSSNSCTLALPSTPLSTTYSSLISQRPPPSYYSSLNHLVQVYNCNECNECIAGLSGCGLVRGACGLVRFTRQGLSHGFTRPLYKTSLAWLYKTSLQDLSRMALQDLSTRPLSHGFTRPLYKTSLAWLYKTSLQDLSQRGHRRL